MCRRHAQELMRSNEVMNTDLRELQSQMAVMAAALQEISGGEWGGHMAGAAGGGRARPTTATTTTTVQERDGGNGRTQPRDGPGAREDFQAGDRVIAEVSPDEEYSGVIEKTDRDCTHRHPRGRAEIQWDDGNVHRSMGLERLRAEGSGQSGAASRNSPQTVRTPLRETFPTARGSPLPMRPEMGEEQEEVRQRQKGLRTALDQDATHARPIKV